MSFVSFSFFALYLLALAVRWGAGDHTQLRIVALLALSWVFYAWHVPQYIFLLLISTLTDYVAGRWIGSLRYSSESGTDPARRTVFLMRGILVGSITINLGLLGYFKYAGLLVTSASEAAVAVGWTNHGWSLSDIVLPIGISFYTFQSMSYTIDVYRGKITPERNFVRLACYIAFFPQLVAGPIVRAGEFLYQLDRRRHLRARVFCEGSYLILRGFFLKLVVADNLGHIVDQYWEQAATEPHGLIALSVLVFFACQLFCDFAGYTDIARGVAYQLGFRLPINFNAPYIAASFSEFWHRWHITLSRWMRDYVYIPLGGNRCLPFRIAVNLLLVMLVAGLWHGANWTFVIWGAVLGAALVAERALGYNSQRPNLVIALLWFVVVQFVWILSLGLFRADDLHQGLAVISHSLLAVPHLVAGAATLEGENKLIIVGWWFTLPVWLLHGRVWLTEHALLPEPGSKERAVYAGVMLASVLTLYSIEQPFIYFQF